MHESDLYLEPNEASDLCPVFAPDVLLARGWDRAFVTVLDEATAEGAIAVVAHRAGAGLAVGWTAIRVKTEPDSSAGRTTDAESCARRGGFVYLLGSQFGEKAGPLQARRSWIARVSEESLVDAIDGGTAKLEIARLRFGIHRAVNDALATAAVDLLPLGPRARSAYIDATVEIGAAKGKRWAGRVISSDHPINVEGMEFRADGKALLGLRYPVTADGHPLLVELDDLDALFDEPETVPCCSNVWVLTMSEAATSPPAFERFTPSATTVSTPSSATSTPPARARPSSRTTPRAPLRARSMCASSCRCWPPAATSRPRPSTTSATSVASRASWSTTRAIATTSSTKKAAWPCRRSSSAEETAPHSMSAAR